VPPAIQELKDLHPDLVDKWYAHCEASQALYEELTAGLSEMYKDLDSKVERRKKARQAARSVLPNATETKVFCTANGRAIRHFVEMRANPAADLEIRMLAVKIFDILSTEFPLLVHGMRKIELPDGTHGVESDYPKV
jgi:thymidylate synthase (FAD)